MAFMAAWVPEGRTNTGLITSATLAAEPFIGGYPREIEAGTAWLQ
jgi:hypothetical protein